MKNGKNGKFMAAVSVTLVFAVLAPFAASAAQPVKNIQRQSTAAVLAQRSQIAQLNADIVSLKSQERQLVAQIRKDLAGTKNIPAITQSQDYQDIVAVLGSLKGSLDKASRIDYKSSLRNAKAKSGESLSSTLNSVISLQTQKKSELQDALLKLENVLSKADVIAQQKADLLNKWNQFRSQAVAKKNVIDKNHVVIVQTFADCRNLISQIAATAAANGSALSSKQADVAAIEAQLGTITGELKGIYDGSISAAQNVYKQDKKDKNYTDAIKQLDVIIGIQQQRISTLSQVKTQLQAVLGTLNALVSGTASPASSSSAA